ncbi:MAG: glycosyltransferase family 4 protein [Thermoplasmata archaeon]|nr:glycosyltransferase family 4 protein [Thermoplasmata archaeon]
MPGRPQGDRAGRSVRRPRVAVVTHVYPPWTGGAEFYHQLVSRELAKQADVCVFTADYLLRPGSQVGRTIPPADPEAEGDPFPVRYLPSWRFFGENLLRPRPLFRALREFDPDVIWGNFPSLSADFGVGWGMLRGIPWVATYHADLDIEHIYARPFGTWEGWLLRRASAILVTTPRHARLLVGRGVARDRILVIPLGPGIGLGVLPPVDIAGAAPGSLPGKDHAVLFVGGLDWGHSYKRPERLLEALASLRSDGVEIFAWFVGDGDRRAEVEADCAKVGLTPYVQFLGRLTDAELARRFRSAWILVLTGTESEGFGVVATEAVHYGCPVLSSEGPGIGPLLVETGAGIVYPSRDPRALERALRELWLEPGRRHRLAERTTAAAALFSWDQALPQLTAPILHAGAAHAEAVR